MTRLLVHVEGQTEEAFVNQVLAPHLYQRGYESVSARLLGDARQRSKRGGARAWVAVCREIVRHLKQDTGCIATTMVDFFGLPQSGEGAWPGRASAVSTNTIEMARIVEEALHADLCSAFGSNFDGARFVPFVVMHEYEGLLFSDCQQFGDAIGRPDLTAAFQQIRGQFSSPEDINDSPDTAPSKRLLQLFPGYEKPLFGAIAAGRMGLDVIRSECPHFRGWLERLEQIP